MDGIRKIIGSRSLRTLALTLSEVGAIIDQAGVTRTVICFIFTHSQTHPALLTQTHSS